MIRSIDPRSERYSRDYRAGRRASQNLTEDRDGRTALERADARGVSHAWYDGYHDGAADRPMYTYRAARRLGVEVDALPDEAWNNPQVVK
jgi:hypothetical protein